MKCVLPILDAAVGTLIDDLDERGLLDSTMVLVMGEFGRTPRMNTTGVPGADPGPRPRSLGQRDERPGRRRRLRPRPGRRLLELKRRGPQGPSRPARRTCWSPSIISSASRPRPRSSTATGVRSQSGRPARVISELLA